MCDHNNLIFHEITISRRWLIALPLGILAEVYKDFIIQSKVNPRKSVHSPGYSLLSEAVFLPVDFNIRWLLTLMGAGVMFPWTRTTALISRLKVSLHDDRYMRMILFDHATYILFVISYLDLFFW